MKKSALASAAAIVAAALLAATGPASAYVFSIDNFFITKNGNPLFEDPFDGGGPPPAAPNFANGNPTGYTTLGVFGETGGKAIMDSANAVISPSGVSGQLQQRHRARLLTDINDASNPLGLKTDDTFIVEALFDLTLPTPAGDFFYLRLTDSTPTTGNDILELRVRLGSAGDPIVQFREIDDALNTITVLATDVIPTSGGSPVHDQIMLRLAKETANSNVITASYQYFNSGVGQGNASFADIDDIKQSDTIFRGEEWTRAEFGAIMPVPEPLTLALFGLGLATLGLARRRRAA